MVQTGEPGKKAGTPVGGVTPPPNKVHPHMLEGTPRRLIAARSNPPPPCLTPLSSHLA